MISQSGIVVSTVCFRRMRAGILRIAGIGCQWANDRMTVPPRTIVTVSMRISLDEYIWNSDSRQNHGPDCLRFKRSIWDPTHLVKRPLKGSREAVSLRLVPLFVSWSLTIRNPLTNFTMVWPIEQTVLWCRTRCQSYREFNWYHASKPSMDTNTDNTSWAFLMLHWAWEQGYWHVNWSWSSFS